MPLTIGSTVRLCLSVAQIVVAALSGTIALYAYERASGTIFSISVVVALACITTSVCLLHETASGEAQFSPPRSTPPHL